MIPKKIYHFIQNIFYSHWPILIILTASLAPILWFKGDFLITGTDVDFSPFNVERFIHRFQTWDAHFMGGSDRANTVASLFFVGIFAIFELLGFEPQTVEKLGFIFWLLAVGLSMYFLMGQLVTIKSKNLYSTKISRLSASMMYMYGFYNVFLWVRLQLSLSTLVLFPAFLGILIATLNGRLRLAVASLLMALLAIVCSSTGIQPPLILIFSFYILCFIFFKIFLVDNLNLKSAKNSLRICTVLSIAYICGSMFWLIPLFSYVYSSGYLNSGVGAEVYSVKTLLTWVSSNTSFLQLFRQYGDVAWFDGWGGYLYWPDMMDYTSNPILIFLSFLIVLISLIPLLSSEKIIRKYYVIFFCYLVILSIFLSKGVHPPFGSLYLWLVDNFPFFWVQRAPWQKFGLLLSMSLAVLFGVGIGVISHLLSDACSKVKNFILFKKLTCMLLPLLLVLILSVIYNWKFVTGAMYSNGAGESRFGYHERLNLGFHIKYPDYIYSFREYINEQDDYFRIFFLPDATSSVYLWGYAGSTDITFGLLNKGLIYRSYGEGLLPPNTLEGLQDLLGRMLLADRGLGATRLLGKWGVKYIVLRKDYWDAFYGANQSKSPELIAKKLQMLEPGIRLEKSFGEWDLYRINNDFISSIVSIPNKLIFLPPKDTGPIGNSIFLEKLSISANESTEFNKILYMREGQEFPNSLRSFSGAPKTSSINFSILSPTDIEINLIKVTGQIPIVFNEGFHKGWQMYVDSGANYKFGWLSYLLKNFQLLLPIDSISKSHIFPLRPVDDANHFLANGYANAWLLNVDELCSFGGNCVSNADGTYDLKLRIRYSTQKLFYLGILLSLFSIVVSATFILLPSKK